MAPKNQTLNRILDNAETLFAKHGFNGTSTRQIATAAGISIQTLHYHGGGKLKLYNTVLERTIVPVTDMINRHVQEMLKKNLNNDAVLEECINKLIDELFDVLIQHPNYAQLFYRQWLETDPEMRRVEWERLVPFFKKWEDNVDTIVDKNRRKGLDLPLLILSLSWIYWGLFVEPNFIGQLLGLAPGDRKFLERLKSHAKTVTIRMLGRAT